MSKKSLYRATGWLLILESILMFMPIAILGQAINWPQSLNEPAAVVLPLLAQKASEVRLGYLLYLVYSILFWLVALLTVRVVRNSESESIWLRLATGFGIASMIARCLGIIRWLVAMPALAILYMNPATSTQAREVIAVVYRVLNDYAGAIGEVLGVSLFTALWLVIVSSTILRSNVLPHWIGFLGLFAATLLAVQLAELFGIDLGAFISVSVGFLQLWFLLTGIVILLRLNRI
jgi:Domain of unknown function (DUF4386)